jgi:hypothetical protein
VYGVVAAKQTAESRLKGLLAKHPFPPLEVIIRVLEKSGRGEQELVSQEYDTIVAITKGIMEIPI